MAITATQELQAQARIAEKAQAQELRTPNFGTVQKLHENRSIVYPFLTTPEGDMTMDPEAANDSAQVAVFKNENEAVKTAIQSSHTGDAPATATQSITWSVAAADFNISMKDASDNFFKHPELFENQLLIARQKVLTAVETAAKAYLESNKTGVSAISATAIELPGTTFDGSITTVANAQKDLFFSLLSEIMDENDYKGMLDFVHEGGFGVLAKDFLAQGEANSTNKQYQVADNLNLMRSRLTKTGTQYGLGYAFPEGGVGLVTALPKLNRDGMEHENQVWDSMPDPVYPDMTWGLHIIEGVEDGNKNQDAVQKFELSLHYAMNDAYLSTTDETVIHKIELLNS